MDKNSHVCIDFDRKNTQFLWFFLLLDEKNGLCFASMSDTLYCVVGIIIKVKEGITFVF